MKSIRVETHATTIALAQLVRAMQAGQYDCHQLAEITGLNLNTVYRYAAAFYRAGAAHICELRPDSRGAYKTRVFKLYPGIDARPPKRTRAERARRQRKMERGPDNVLTSIAQALTCVTTQ